MPIYEYACDQCGHAFKAIVRGQRLLLCQSCNGADLSRQIAVFAVSPTSSVGHERYAVHPRGVCGDPRGPGTFSIN